MPDIGDHTVSSVCESAMAVIRSLKLNRDSLVHFEQPRPTARHFLSPNLHVLAQERDGHTSDVNYHSEFIYVKL